MTRYLVTGGQGMLGTDLGRALAGRVVTRLSRTELDITDLAAVRSAVDGSDVVINAAAYTRVDDAENDEVKATLINGTAVGHLATAARECGAAFVQISTDYVFDGTATSPYAERAPLAPMSAYGRSKAEGERLALTNNPERSYVVRTAWLYGSHGANFAKTMLRLASERDEVSVVTDQIGQPTWTLDLAERIVALTESGGPAGIYHATNSGQVSWFDFARAIFKNAGLDPDRVKPTDSKAFVRPAPRPAYSVLGHGGWSGVGLRPMRDWHAALADWMSREPLE